MEIELFVDDLLKRMREHGYDAKVTYCYSSKGEIVSFEIKIVGYLQ